MHDAIFANQKDLSDAALADRARAVGLDRVQYEGCLKTTGSVRVKQDLSSAVRFGVNGTPTFFLGTIESDDTVKVAKRLDGIKTIEAFRAALDPLVADAAKAR